MAATTYGVVDDGKYKLCKVCMNSDNTTLVFIKVAAEEGRHVIAEDIQGFTLVSEHEPVGSTSIYTIQLLYRNGETSNMVLRNDEKQGSALPSAAERLAAQYKTMAKFLGALMSGGCDVSPETKQWVNKIMRYAQCSEY